MSKLMTVLLAAFAFLCAPVTSFAETPASAAARWGLLGTWRTQCDAPPSRQDVVLTYVLRGGRLFNDRNWGDGTDSILMPSATIRPDGTLDLTFEITSIKQTRQAVMTKSGDDRMFTLWNRNVSTREHSIRDGKVVPSGTDAGQLVLCSR